jgi:hypothetical protein
MFPEAKSWCRFHRRAKQRTSSKECLHLEATRLRKIAALFFRYDRLSKKMRADAIHVKDTRSIREYTLVIFHDVSAQSSKLSMNFIVLMQGGHGQQSRA